MVQLDQAGQARGVLRLVAPPPNLVPWVEHVWLHPRPADAARMRGWRIVADANAHIVVARGRGTAAHLRAMLVGARSRYADTNMAERAWTVGVRLNAGAIPALTGLAAHELTDTELPLTELRREGTSELRDRLEQAGTPEAASAALLVFLRGSLAGPDAATLRSARLLDLLRHSRAHSVRGLADELGVAERTLHQLCVTRIGLAPRRIIRIMRLHGALQRALEMCDGWARIAALHGYADQSHLTREFGVLLGEPPAAFLQRGRAG